MEYINTYQKSNKLCLMMATLIKENVFLVVVSSFKRTKKKKRKLQDRCSSGVVATS